jgi:hypothetical protein
MINSFENLDKDSLSDYRTDLLNKILPFLRQINFDILSKESDIIKNNERWTISLIHRHDTNTRLIFNIYNNYLSVWYGPCNVSFYKDMGDEISLKQIEYLIKSKYFSTNFFYKTKLIYSEISFDNNVLPKMIVNSSLFSRLYKYFFKSKIVPEKQKYRSFIN